MENWYIENSEKSNQEGKFYYLDGIHMTCMKIPIVSPLANNTNT